MVKGSVIRVLGGKRIFARLTAGWTFEILQPEDVKLLWLDRPLQPLLHVLSLLSCAGLLQLTQFRNPSLQMPALLSRRLHSHLVAGNHSSSNPNSNSTATAKATASCSLTQPLLDCIL